MITYKKQCMRTFFTLAFVIGTCTLPKIAQCAARPVAEPVGRKYTRQDLLTALINQKNGLLKSWPPGVVPIITEYLSDSDCMRKLNVHDDVVTIIAAVNQERKKRFDAGIPLAEGASLKVCVSDNTPIARLVFNFIYSENSLIRRLRCWLFTTQQFHGNRSFPPRGIVENPEKNCYLDYKYNFESNMLVCCGGTPLGSELLSVSDQNSIRNLEGNQEIYLPRETPTFSQKFLTGSTLFVEALGHNNVAGSMAIVWWLEYPETASEPTELSRLSFPSSSSSSTTRAVPAPARAQQQYS